MATGTWFRRQIADNATVTRHYAPNNFDALRLLAALLVILGHGQELKGFTPTIFWHFPISRFGLNIFFSISGYLVCGSYLQTQRLTEFLAKRMLRIFPALIVCVAVTALVIGPLTTSLPAWKYFGHHQTWDYFLNDLLFLQLRLPGVFGHRLEGMAVNGSLWSLFPEFLCYLFLPLAFLAGRWGRVMVLLATMVGCGLLGLWMFDNLDQQIGLIYGADPKYVLVQIPFFMAGALLRLVQIRFSDMFRLDFAVVCTASLFMLPQVLGMGSVKYEWLPLAYVVIALGQCSTPILNRAARYGDFSYGMYLYAFPLQQLMLDHGPAWAIVRCTLASLTVAFLSWHPVEAPALRLKTRATMWLKSPRTSDDWSKGLLTRQVLRHAVGSPVLPAIVSGLLLLVYASQLNLGRWQIDEFHYFTDQRLLGFYATITRVTHGWPRPFSELLIYLYGQTILALGKPLASEALALLWIGLVAGMVLAVRASLRPSPFRLATAFSLATALMVFVMETNPITEMFYWPVASVAYLPTIGAIVALLFLMDDDPEPQHRLWSCVALLVAATSHEIGAAFAIGVAVAGTSRAVLTSRGVVASSPRHVIASVAKNAWWLIPGLVGLYVMASVILFRSANVDLGADTKPYTGHLTASALAALQQLVTDAVTTGYSGPSPAAILGALVTKALFAVGFVLVWLRVQHVRLGFWRIAFAFGVTLAAFFSLFAGFYHYGDLCCERQFTIRHWLIDLLWILAALELVRRLQRWPALISWRPSLMRLGPGILALSLFPVIFRFVGIREDLKMLSMSRQAIARTWASGQQPGTNRMVFYLPPDHPSMLVHGTSVRVGTYTVSGDSPQLITEIGRFFGKSVITTCQPWQSDKSFLYNGRFIPACPSHPGPPDIVYNSH